MFNDKICRLESFAFINPSGGTGLSDWEHNERFQGIAEIKVIHHFSDYETGERFWGEAISPDLIAYMKRNADPNDQRVLFSEFEITSIKDKPMKEAFSPLTWKKILPARGPAYHRGMLGKIPAVVISPMMSSMGKWAVNYALPGIQTPMVDYDSIDNAKSAAADEINNWLENAGLEVSDVQYSDHELDPLSQQRRQMLQEEYDEIQAAKAELRKEKPR